MKKKPTTVTRRHSDCSVQRQAAKSVKSLKKTFYNALVRYNEEWPPLPAPSPFRPAHQGKKPIQLEQRRWVTFLINKQKDFQEQIKQMQRDIAKKERKQVRKRQRERNRKRDNTRNEKKNKSIGENIMKVWQSKPPN